MIMVKKNTTGEHSPKPSTPKPKRKPEQRFDAMRKAAVAHVASIHGYARHVERIMEDGDLALGPSYPAEVRGALSALLLELSNESSTYYSTPGVAAAFYRTAVFRAEQDESLSWAGKTALRHLRVLLNNPNRQTAKALSAFWDVQGSYGPDKDPFPEKAARRKGGAR
jgi:hypothetical protein